MKKAITLICVFILTFNMLAFGVCAEEITPTPTITPQDVFYIATDEFIEQIWEPLVSYVSIPFAIMNSSFATAEDYFEWLQDLGEPEPWVQYPNVKVHSTHPPTGNIPLDVEQSTSVEVPIPVQNSILAFVQYQIAQNPQGFKSAYIKSYNYLSTTQFNSIAQFNAVKDFIKNSNSYCYLKGTQSYSQLDKVIIVTIPKSIDSWALIGSVINGSFSNVQTTVNWSTNNTYMYLDNRIQEYYINPDGSQGLWNRGVGCNPVGNGNTIDLGTGTTIFSTLPDSEVVYVFDTLAAYKNYNSGVPKDYYLTSDGINDPSWDASGNGIINTGQLDQSSYSYNNVISNVQSGWTAEEVLALVDRISQGGGTNGNGNGSNGNNSDGWLDLGIFGDIGRAIANILGGIIEAIATVFTEIINIVTQVSDTLLQGTIFEFLSAFIGWLPEEIIALLTALFSVAVLFALIKLIREAF